MMKAFQMAQNKTFCTRAVILITNSFALSKLDKT